MYRILFTTTAHGDCTASESDHMPLEKRLRNREKLMKEFGVQAGHLITPIPTSDRSIAVVNEPIFDLDKRPHAECIITQNRDLAVGVFAADCLQVLLVDEDVSTIGAMHLSRRNLCGEFVENAIDMIRDMASSSKINAHLGPCLQRESHTLAEKTALQLIECAPDAESYLTQREDSFYLFDYSNYAAKRLRDNSVDINSQSDVNTLTSDDYYSLRGRLDRQSNGSHLGVIAFNQ